MSAPGTWRRGGEGCSRETLASDGANNDEAVPIVEQGDGLVTPSAVEESKVAKRARLGEMDNLVEGYLKAKKDTMR